MFRPAARESLEQFSRFQHAGPESGPDIAAIRSVKVSISHANQTRSRRPGTSPQGFVRSKPGARVFFVRIFGEARIGKEVTGSPLPHVADHLTAAVRRVAVRMTGHIAAAICSPVEIGGRDTCWNSGGSS